ncbi:hypothetical protein Taro_034585 [Colocasia esculenta]|uniref:Uncharacterized protein n=1 Tax=Colocasia esculenta TaxID=4460 RepID=A0A843W191_COLES|nr:hypothetical protein [Colocasia esculenta]
MDGGSGGRPCSSRLAQVRGMVDDAPSSEDVESSVWQGPAVRKSREESGRAPPGGGRPCSSRLAQVRGMVDDAPSSEDVESSVWQGPAVRKSREESGRAPPGPPRLKGVHCSGRESMKLCLNQIYLLGALPPETPAGALPPDPRDLTAQHRERKGCSCCAAFVASVVARRVHVVAARLALDSLVVVFLVWRMLAGKSRRALQHLLVVVVSLALTGCELWLRCITWLPCVLSLRCAIGLAGAFWRVFPEQCLGGSGGGSSQNHPFVASGGGSSQEYSVLVLGHRCVAPVVRSVTFGWAAFWGLRELADYPFPLCLLFFPFPSSPVMGRLPSSDSSVERPAARGGAWERCRGVRRRWPCVVKALHGFGSSLQASGSAWFLLCLPRLSPGARHLRAYLVHRLSLFPGTPILRSLLREYSGLRACSSLGHRGWPEFYPVQASQSLVSLPLSALVPEPRSGVRRAEAGAWLASRACGLRVPLLDASGGGLVAVVVTIPVLLVVSALVFSRFRGSVLGSQSVVALAGRRGSVASWVSAATVIRVATRMCVAFFSRPRFPSRLGVATDQRVVTAFCPVGRLTLVRVALVGYPFPLSLLFFPFPSSPMMGRLPSGEPGVERPAARGGAWERCRGARRRWPCVMKALLSFTAFPMLLPCGVFVRFVGGPGLRIPLVCLPTGVATARRITTSEEASAHSGVPSFASAVCMSPLVSAEVV